MPFSFGRRQNILCPARCLEEAVDGGSIVRGPATIEGVADDCDWPLCAEALHDPIHGDRAPEPFAFEIGAKIPVNQGRVGLALLAPSPTTGAARHRQLLPRTVCGNGGFKC